MDSSDREILFNFPHLIRVYNDGTVERLAGTDFVPPSTDPLTGVVSKDVTIAGDDILSARLFLPKLNHPSQTLPLLVYFHGGCFCVSSPFIARYHNYLNRIVSEANVIAVSVSYGLAPENPIPAAYEDSMAAIRWIASHKNKDGPEEWLNRHADFERVFLGGESSGGNIVHNLTVRVREPGYELGLDISGIALVHPMFWGSDRLESEIEDYNYNFKAMIDKMWAFVCPSNPDNDDPRVNPFAAGAPCLSGLGCKRVLVCVAEKDPMRDRGKLYCETLNRIGWTGVVEMIESEGEAHGFHLTNIEDEKSKVLIKRLADFYNGNMPSL